MTCCLTAAAADTQTGTGETDGYRLVWQDLFDGTELSADRWNIEVNGDGGGNNELQYYTDQQGNVRIGDDGRGNRCLILTARRESYGGRSFTSGRVNSKNKVTFTHGKIEAAIRMPRTANGLWPAFWMMGNDIDAVGWPRCGEIDIVEMGHQNAFGAGTQDRFFNGACHWGQGWPSASYALDTTKEYSLQDGEFHIFTLIWNDQTVEMYVDLDKYPAQTPYYKMDIPQNEPGNEWSPGNYFHKDNFILFNLAVGGNFPGMYNAWDITALNDGNGNEASMYINYVKVYQKGTSDERFYSLVPGDGQGGDVPGPDDPDPIVTDGPTVDKVLENGKVSDVLAVVLDAASVSKFEAQGANVTNAAPNNENRNLWIWSNTFTSGSPSYPGVGGHTEGYVDMTVGSAGWSGAGFNIEAPGVGTEWWNDETRFHAAYRSKGAAPASIALIIADGETNCGSVPAKIALGAPFVDNGATYPSAAPASTGEWQGVDLSFAQLRQLWPGFSPKALASWTGNILSFLGGGSQGTNVSLDAVYFYRFAGADGIDEVATDLEWVVTANTINVTGADGISLYDLSGKLVKSVQGTTMGIDELAGGMYIARSGNSVRKIVIR